MAQWIERWPAHRKVTGSIPSGHMPGLRARSPVGGVREASDQRISQALMFLSLSFSLPSPLAKKIFKIFKKKSIKAEGGRGCSRASQTSLFSTEVLSVLSLAPGVANSDIHKARKESEVCAEPGWLSLLKPCVGPCSKSEPTRFQSSAQL